MKCIGERGTLFACQTQGEHPAHVRYKPYTAWSSAASQSEWTYDLQGNTTVIGLAAGGSKAQKSRDNDDDTGNLVIATSDNDLTFISGNKTEKFIMGLDGDFVSMVAGEEWVFYVHRPGATTIDGTLPAKYPAYVKLNASSGSQGLMGTIVTFDSFCILQSKPLPIRKGHTLKWVGITEEGASRFLFRFMHQSDLQPRPPPYTILPVLCILWQISAKLIWAAGPVCSIQKQ